MSEKIYASTKELKVGKYVLIDGIPCRIASIETSRPGKHGSAKMRIVGIGIFDGEKKNLLTTSGADVEVPIIERKSVQVLSVSGNSVQVMDSASYEVFDMAIPEEFQGQVEAGKEIEVLEAMGRKAMIRVR